MDRQYAGCQIHMPSGKQAHNKLRKQEDLRDTCKASYTFLLPRGLASNCDTELEVTQASQVQPQESSEPEAEIRIFPGAGMADPQPWDGIPPPVLLSLHSLVRLQLIRIRHFSLVVPHFMK